MYYLEKIALWLTVIGGINWGLIGIFDYNLVAFIFGSTGLISRLIYILVGLSAIWTAYAQIMPEHTIVIEHK